MYFELLIYPGSTVFVGALHPKTMIGLCRIDSENFKFLKFLNMRLNLSTFSLHRNAASPDEIQSCRLLSHQSSTITTRLPPWVISFLTRHFTMDNTLADDVRFLDFFFSAKRTASTEDCSTNAAHRPTYTTNEPINARLTKRRPTDQERHRRLQYLQMQTMGKCTKTQPTPLPVRTGCLYLNNETLQASVHVDRQLLHPAKHTRNCGHRPEITDILFASMALPPITGLVCELPTE